MNAVPHSKLTTAPTSGREWPLLLVLAGAQFSHILDFVLVMPLGPQFMRVLSISPQQFAFLVSVYTFSASIFGFLGTLFIDRFDRKSALIGLYAGFTTGTFLCAVAPHYHALLAARAVAGGFGGLMGAVIFSIIGDAFIESRRGAATGTVMSAFSLASVLGVPFGLYLATNYTWQAPFLLLSLLSLGMIIAAFRILPPLRGHLVFTHRESVSSLMKFMIFNKNNLIAYALIVSLMFAAFTVIPFISAYLVKNVGFSERQLPYVYLSGGAFTLVTSRLIGKLADRFGKQRIFTIAALASIFPLLLLTNLPRVQVVAAIVTTTLFTILISGRSVPAMSMITSSVEAHHRGSFMSLTTAIQQMASGLASLVGGWMLTEAPNGELLHYDWIGYLAAGATLLSVVLANRLKLAS